MGLFDKLKGGSAAMGMVMDFISNPDKLKQTLMTQLFPHLEKSLIKHIESVKLDERECQSAIILYKNPVTGKLDYVLATLTEEDAISRQIEVANVENKLDEMASKLKLTNG